MLNGIYFAYMTCLFWNARPTVHRYTRIFFEDTEGITSVSSSGTDLSRHSKTESDQLPLIAPKGGTVAFTHPSEDEAKHSILWVMDSNGSHRKSLGIFAYGYAWAPDGRDIAYIGPGGDSTGQALYKIDADGRNQRFITPIYGADYWTIFSWSPQGNRLLYALSYYTGWKSENDKLPWASICTASMSGEKPKELMRIQGFAPHPQWSPDGKSIAYIGSPPENSHAKRYFGLYNYSLKTRKVNRIAFSGEIGDFCWSPDGRFIAAAVQLFSDPNHSKLYRYHLKDKTWTDVTPVGCDKFEKLSWGYCTVPFQQQRPANRPYRSPYDVLRMPDSQETRSSNALKR